MALGNTVCGTSRRLRLDQNRRGSALVEITEAQGQESGTSKSALQRCAERQGTKWG